MTARSLVPADVPDERGRARTIQWIALIAGVGIILAAVSPPVDEIVDAAFSAHMLQHMVLTNVGAVLLAVAWPLVLGRWRESRIVVVLNKLASPAPAILIVVSSGVLWFWHIPALYDAALAHELAHAAEHLLFIGAFVLFWRPLMPDSMAGQHLRSNEGRVLYLTAGMLAMGVLAAFITFEDSLLYSHYENSSPGGRTPLQDQELGGAVMLIFGAVSTIVIGILTLREEPAQRQE
jgi:putative membrane protein